MGPDADFVVLADRVKCFHISGDQDVVKPVGRLDRGRPQVGLRHGNFHRKIILLFINGIESDDDPKENRNLF